MAYDNNGEYYFNPQIDSEDAALLEQSNKLEGVQAYKNQAAAQQASTRAMGEHWNAALKEAGIDQATYDQLCAQNPAGAARLIRGSMTAVTKAIASHKGRPPAPQKGQPQPTRETAPVANSGRLNQLKEKAAKGILTEEEQLEGIGALTEGLDWR